ncbi:MAG: hypothetical protein EP329_11500 [Deltaproteobacteria bacterium]|nr:MAG: hypothetical protein EP329_11500 [Deltaproteobacteria bacterium]
MRPIIIASLLAVLPLTVVSTPSAQANVDLRRVDSSLVDLPFGGDVDAVSSWVRQRLERLFAPRLKAAVDDNDRAKLRAQLDREVDDFNAHLVAFDGRRTGYEVSPVAGEFMAGSNESMLVLRDPDGDHFFFLIDGKMWKYARMLPIDNPFPDRIAEQSRRLKKPDQVDTAREDGPEPTAVRAIWTGDTLRLRLWNRRLLYGYDLMVVEYRPLADKIDELRGGRVSSKLAPKIDDNVDSFLLDDGVDEEELLRKKNQGAPEK